MIRALNMSDYAWIIPEYAWICLNIPDCAEVYMKMAKSTRMDFVLTIWTYMICFYFRLSILASKISNLLPPWGPSDVILIYLLNIWFKRVYNHCIHYYSLSKPVSIVCKQIISKTCIVTTIKYETALNLKISIKICKYSKIIPQKVDFRGVFRTQSNS